MLVLPCLQVKMEEKSLMERYGQVYADYKARVKRFFPYVY
jgi:protein-S-isoprenylcysteine O-methyltransferase Ste14